MPIDEIEVIKQKLVDQIKPIGVYLFGSFANGTAHADSDFDFYTGGNTPMLCWCSPAAIRRRIRNRPRRSPKPI